MNRKKITLLALTAISIPLVSAQAEAIVSALATNVADFLEIGGISAIIIGLREIVWTIITGGDDGVVSKGFNFNFGSQNSQATRPQSSPAQQSTKPGKTDKSGTSTEESDTSRKGSQVTTRTKPGTGIITGIVLEEETGLPLFNVVVSAKDTDLKGITKRRPFQDTIMSVFEIVNVPLEEVEITAEKECHEPKSAKTRPNNKKPVIIKLKHTGETGKVKGLIIDSEKKPVNSATVRTEYPIEKGKFAKTTSSTDGSYSLTLPLYRQYELKAFKGRSVPAKSYAFELTHEEPEISINLQITEGDGADPSDQINKNLEQITTLHNNLFEWDNIRRIIRTIESNSHDNIKREAKKVLNAEKKIKKKLDDLGRLMDIKPEDKPEELFKKLQAMKKILDQSERGQEKLIHNLKRIHELAADDSPNEQELASKLIGAVAHQHQELRQYETLINQTINMINSVTS